jgi:dTDP-4-amino-4,6-dideoxygalactose transaminase
VKIPFNKPYVTGRELGYIQQAHERGRLSGDGPFSKACEKWLEDRLGCPKALLTHSCTAALEMTALLIDIRRGDEVIMPSFTFVSTANAFVLRGGVPVFVDIRPDTLNIDEALIESAINPRTKAIVPVHYAGVGCEMDPIMEIARRHGLFVIEDAAQGVMSRYKDRALGSIGHFGALSFHETKNIIAGEGGAVLVNAADFIAQAEVIREKGTDRAKFFRGEVDKYTWQAIGSSFLPSDITAAFLWGQLEDAESLISRRQAIWNRYHQAFESLEARGLVVRPTIPDHCQHNGHIYYLILPERDARDKMLSALKSAGIGAIFHYVPLHSSPAGREYGRAAADLPHTDRISECLVRLPIWVGMTGVEIDHVISAVEASAVSL